MTRTPCSTLLGIGASALAVAQAAQAQSVPAESSPPLGAPPIVIAQATTGGGFGTGSGESLLPGTGGGYLGINVGRPKYKMSCGAGGFECDDPDVSLHLYTGGSLNRIFGLEFGYLRLAGADRAGGRTFAHGLNVSAVARAPLAPFNLFAKGGVTYGRTEVTANAASGVPNGKESGWGGSYGVGAGYDLSPRSAVVLEWQRHDFKFVGVGRENVDTTSLGYLVRF